QRNLSVRLCRTAFLAFFDDDVVLRPECLRLLEETLRDHEEIVGVGAYPVNGSGVTSLRWTLMHRLGAIPALVPGRYHRSGVSIPIELIRSGGNLIPVDRLPGAGFLWRTPLLRQLGFSDRFNGYSSAEDVEISRRAARFGSLVVCRQAEMAHYP